MNPKSFLVLLAGLAGLVPAASPAAAFRAPQRPAPLIATLDAPTAKAAAPAIDDSGRLRVGDVRALPKAASVPAWSRVEGGFVTRFMVSSAGAQGLRVRLDLAAVPGAMDVRMQGSDGEVEEMVLDPRLGPDAWTAWTAGDSQLVELFSEVLPADAAVRVGAVLHFTAEPTAKAAGSCTVPSMCGSGDVALDAAIATAKKGVMRLQFVEGGSGYVCTGTLIDSEKRPAAFVATAYHCIHDEETARSVTTLWFYENATCDAASTISRTQVSGGGTLVFANHNVDSSLFQLNASPPTGAVYVPTNSARLASGDAIVSLSHPSGDALRLALGAVNTEYRIEDAPQDFYGIKLSRGIIEGGSSGSGLFTLSAGQLQLRGMLSGTTVRNGSGMSCTNLNEEALYTRLDIFAPQLQPFIKAGGVAADDAPNRAQDLFAQVNALPLDQMPGSQMSRNGLRIDYAGDMDVFSFDLSRPAVVSAWSEGANLDTVGTILSSTGVWLDSNDDATSSNNHFGVSHFLQPGRYYVQVGHWEPNGTGTYNLRLRADVVEQTNFTDLWNNPSESGWGLNVNHQDNTIFASLYSYDAAGAPMWLVMSNGDRQADGSYQGTLFRGTGPAFNAANWTGVQLTPVGTMKLVFSGVGLGTLTYSVDGVQVTKAISRYVFAKAPTCTWSAFDRSYASNFQDLWLSPAEPGWGVSLAHQGSTLFAALYTYDASGRPLWLVMSAGAETGDGKFSGTLYRTTGPAFNAAPWTPAQSTAVGTMSYVFTDGNHGTLTYTYNGTTVTKQIQRYAFGTVKPACD